MKYGIRHPLFADTDQHIHTLAPSRNFAAQKGFIRAEYPDHPASGCRFKGKRPEARTRKYLRHQSGERFPRTDDDRQPRDEIRQGIAGVGKPLHRCGMGAVPDAELIAVVMSCMALTDAADDGQCQIHRDRHAEELRQGQIRVPSPARIDHRHPSGAGQCQQRPSRQHAHPKEGKHFPKQRPSVPESESNPAHKHRPADAHRHRDPCRCLREEHQHHRQAACQCGGDPAECLHAGMGDPCGQAQEQIIHVQVNDQQDIEVDSMQSIPSFAEWRRTVLSAVFIIPQRGCLIVSE